MLACPNKAFIEQMFGAIRIAEVSEEITDLAGSLADLVLSKTQVQAFIREIFKETEETIAMLEVTRTSKLKGKTHNQVAELTDSDIIAVKRGQQWTYDPKDDFVLNVGDHVIAVGKLSDIRTLKKMNT